MHAIARLSLGLAFAAAAGFCTSAGLAGPEHVATIESECQTQLGYSPSRCACFRSTAETGLSDNAQAFVAAQVTKNQAAIAETQATLSGDDMMAAINFLTTAPQQCP